MHATRFPRCLVIGLLAAAVAPAVASAAEGPPIISGVSATRVTADSATLNATVKSDGRETQYEMVVALCPEGSGECAHQFATVAEGTIAAAGAPVHLHVNLLVRLDEVRLQSGERYFYFVRARNNNGEQAEVSKTFRTLR